MIGRHLTALLAVISLITVSASAQTSDPAKAASPVVIELFTSQGCSSCPAADALFKDLATRSDVIALSMPVDYWDYLGWKDTLASPKFSKRQRAYAKLRGDGKVYTPQIVVNGRQHVIGSAKAEIEAAVALARAGSAVAALHATVADATITIEMPRSTQPVDDATIWLAVVQAVAKVEVRAGENRGHSLTYYNVVRDLVPLGMWSGAPATIRQHTATLSGSAGDRYAVLLQQGIGGPILAATWATPGP